MRCNKLDYIAMVTFKNFIAIDKAIKKNGIEGRLW